MVYVYILYESHGLLYFISGGCFGKFLFSCRKNLCGRHKSSFIKRYTIFGATLTRTQFFFGDNGQVSDLLNPSCMIRIESLTYEGDDQLGGKCCSRYGGLSGSARNTARIPIGTTIIGKKAIYSLKMMSAGE